MRSDAALEAALAALPIFAGLGREAAGRAAARFELLAAPGGTVLFREGDEADALYVVISGAIGVSARDSAGAERRLARVLAGETLGEIALISQAPRSGTATVLRDSALLRVTRDAFDAFVREWPPAMHYLSRLLSERLRRATAARPTTPPARTIAIVPATAGVDAAGFGRALAPALRACGGGLVALLDAPPAPGEEDRLQFLESAHDLTLQIATDADADWTRLCLRRADHVLHLARAGAPALAAPAPERSVWIRQDLVVLQDAGAARAIPLVGGPPGAELRIQVRESASAGIVAEDLERLARLVLGRAVGLVLSGGGARAFAHLGVLRALAEHRLPVDIVAGTSMGAIVAAGWALGWGPDELRERVEDAFVSTSPLSDWTLPFVSLARGREVDARLERHFGSARVEDLWLPFFCVSANLSSGRSLVHASGPLVQALRASIAIPGLLPPVVTPEGVLVDGALINNLPADLMADLERGPILAVSLAQRVDFGARRRSLLPRLGRRLMGIAPDMPSITGILYRSATLSGDAQEARGRAAASVTLEPPVADIDLRAWRSFPRVVEIGYRAACRAIEEGHLAVLLQTTSTATCTDAKTRDAEPAFAGAAPGEGAARDLS